MTLAHADGVAWTDHDRVALLDLRRPDAASLILEEPGATIWRCAPIHDFESLVNTVADVFEEDADDIRDEVRQFVDSLLEMGLLVMNSPGVPATGL